TTKETISLGPNSGLTTGEAVTYDSEGNTAIGGLTNGTTYYVNVQSGGSVSLYDTEADAVAGATPTIVKFNPSSASAVDTAANAIFVGLNCGLTTGAAVTYDAEGNAVIGGLMSGTQYFVYVQSNGTIQLYDTNPDALAHNGTGLMSLTTTGGGSDQKIVNTAVTSNASFDASTVGIVNTTNNTINVGAGSGLQTGDQVTYNDLSNPAIAGLTNNQPYFVNIQGDRITLYDTEAHALAGGNTGLIDLTSTGSGNQQFTFSPSIHFNPTAVAVRLYGSQSAALAGTSNGLISSLGGGTQNRLIAANTGLTILGPGATGTDQKFVIGSTVNAIQFDPTGTTIQREPIVNTSLNTSNNPLGSTIYVGLATGLQTGDAVTYDPVGNAVISPLTSGGTYYVNVQNNGTILLYNSESDAIANSGAGNSNFVTLTSTGSGTAQNFTFLPSIHFNPTAPSVVDISSSSIFLPPGNG